MRGASLVQSIVEEFERAWKVLPPRVKEEEEMSDKKCLNIASFLCFLLPLSVISPLLIYDLLTMIQERMQESDIELILRFLKRTFSFCIITPSERVSIKI